MTKLPRILIALAAVVAVLLAKPVIAQTPSLVVDVNLTSSLGIGSGVGTITLKDTKYGLVLAPDLFNLTPGIHGFHVHENPDCGTKFSRIQAVPGSAAGGHYDPLNADAHEGPYGSGHLGDLPPLLVATDGTATTPILAPRLESSFIKARSLMIHAGGDNFSDEPAALGGGGARLACGVIPE